MNDLVDVGWVRQHHSACVCLLFLLVCLCIIPSSCSRVSSVGQVTRRANCVSQGAWRWVTLIALWSGTRCSSWCSSFCSSFVCSCSLFSALLSSLSWNGTFVFTLNNNNTFFFCFLPVAQPVKCVIFSISIQLMKKNIFLRFAVS